MRARNIHVCTEDGFNKINDVIGLRKLLNDVRMKTARVDKCVSRYYCLS